MRGVAVVVVLVARLRVEVTALFSWMTRLHWRGWWMVGKGPLKICWIYLARIKNWR